jgi:hypothetical protein
MLGALVTAGHHDYVGKETDRRWEYGEDLSLRQFQTMEYRPAGGMVIRDRAVRSSRIVGAARRSSNATTLPDCFERVLAESRSTHQHVEQRSGRLPAYVPSAVR